jgi:hypothetical protein
MRFVSTSQLLMIWCILVNFLDPLYWEMSNPSCYIQKVATFYEGTLIFTSKFRATKQTKMRFFVNTYFFVCFV